MTEDPLTPEIAPLGSDLPPIPVGSSARRIPYSRESLDEICSVLQASLRPADFKLRGEPIMQADVAGSEGRDAVTLTFWTELNRLDASSPQATVVMDGVEAVDLIEGVEAQFRRGAGSFLIVAVGGKIIVRMGD